VEATERRGAGQRLSAAAGCPVAETRRSSHAAAAEGSGSTGSERRAPAATAAGLKGVSVLATGDCGVAAAAAAATRRQAEVVSGGLMKSVAATSGGDGGMNHGSASTAGTAGLSLKSHVNMRRISVYTPRIHDTSARSFANSSSVSPPRQT